MEVKTMSDEKLISLEKVIKSEKNKRGIGGKYGGDEHYKSGRDDYMTPPEIYQPILNLFERNKFDIDVCCTTKNIPANIYYTKSGNELLKTAPASAFENGLHQKWCGLCFCNPPWNPNTKMRY